jgi:hypothetical protein
MTKEVKMTQGMVAIVDDQDFDLVSSIRWYPMSNRRGYGKTTYAYNPNKSVIMHRLIAGAKDGQFVDHIDGNGLNNVRDNLRVCTRSQNSANCEKRKTNCCGFKGVTIDKRSKKNKYQATITCSGEICYLGVFPTAEAAARAYDAKARELFGEFARCNFED